MKTLDFIHLNKTATLKTVEELQLFLANYQIFYSNLRGFHWNIQGKQFFTLHVKFESMYNEAAEIVDEIAERILALGAVPQHQFSQYLKIASIKEEQGLTKADDIIENILSSYSILIAQERTIIALANAADDDGTADMITGFLRAQEKNTWMICSYLAK